MKRLAFIKSLLRNLRTILEKKFGVNKKINLSLPRRIGRVVDCGSLENCCTARYRGFESLILRKKMKVWFFNQTFFIGLIWRARPPKYKEANNNRNRLQGV